MKSNKKGVLQDLIKSIPPVKSKPSPIVQVIMNKVHKKTNHLQKAQLQDKLKGMNVKRWCYESYHHHERVKLVPYLQYQLMKHIIAGANNIEVKISLFIRDKYKQKWTEIFINACLDMSKKKVNKQMIVNFLNECRFPCQHYQETGFSISSLIKGLSTYVYYLKHGIEKVKIPINSIKGLSYRYKPADIYMPPTKGTADTLKVASTSQASAEVIIDTKNENLICYKSCMSTSSIIDMKKNSSISHKKCMLNSFDVTRRDFKEHRFSTGNIFDHFDSNNHELSISNYDKSIEPFRHNGYSISNNKRGDTVNMLVYGTTTGASSYPKLIKCNGKTPMMPRPVKNSKPFEKGYDMMKQKWFVDVVMHMEKLTVLYIANSKQSNEMMKVLKYVKDVIDPSLRVCDSCFTQMVILESTNQKQHNENTVKWGIMREHIDKDDYLTCILTLGEVKKGGSTNYYNGIVKNESIQCIGNICKEVPFQHGRIQIGNYKEIVHGVSPWIGKRITINLHIQISVLNFFTQNGNESYDDYKKNGFPTKYTYKENN